MLVKKQIALLSICILLLITVAYNIIGHRYIIMREQKAWPSGFYIVTIESSMDLTKQNAYFYQPNTSKTVPLLVSLHSWSGDYKQNDVLAKIATDKGWAYIHPDFRGPNNNPKAGVSQYVISDIDDAIDYAMNTTPNIDKTRILVSGGSGGGLAALAVYMKSEHTLHAVNAWVPITDLIKWYEESLERENDYAKDILAITNSKDGKLDTDEAKRRSPIYWATPLKT